MIDLQLFCIAAGSATPDNSTIIASNGCLLLLLRCDESRRFCIIRSIESKKSSCKEQQAQPFCNSITSYLLLLLLLLLLDIDGVVVVVVSDTFPGGVFIAMNFASILMEATSFTKTPNCNLWSELCSRCCNALVLPEPKNPESNTTGILVLDVGCRGCPWITVASTSMIEAALDDKASPSSNADVEPCTIVGQVAIGFPVVTNVRLGGFPWYTRVLSFNDAIDVDVVTWNAAAKYTLPDDFQRRIPVVLSRGSNVTIIINNTMNVFAVSSLLGSNRSNVWSFLFLW